MHLPGLSGCGRLLQLPRVTMQREGEGPRAGDPDRVTSQLWREGKGSSSPLTSRKSLMALEQVTPVVPQGMFSVTMRKVPLLLPLPPQWSWGRGRRHAGQARSLAALQGGVRAERVPAPACTRSCPRSCTAHRRR